MTTEETIDVDGKPFPKSALLPTSYPHLNTVEWYALKRVEVGIQYIGKRVGKVIGESTVVEMLRTLPSEEHNQIAANFLQVEVKSIQSQPATPGFESSKPRVLKLDVSSYKGNEGEPLLRWFVEIDAAIAAHLINDPAMQVAYAMSKLSGRAKTWAFGKRMADAKCFPTYTDFKEKLREAFEPPKCEFRARAEFLELKQDRRDLHSYVQRARYLVSSIVTDPIDAATQVVTFMKGLQDGPVKTYLFREFPQTMEEAITLALQEDLSQKQAKLHGNTVRGPRPPVQNSGSKPEPMDLCYVSASANASSSNKSRVDKRTARCHRCQKIGHFAVECRAAQPAPQSGANNSRPYGSGQGRRDQSKNGKDQ